MNRRLNPLRISARFSACGCAGLLAWLAGAGFLAGVVSSPAQAPIATPRVVLTNALQIVALSNNIPEGRYEAKFEAVVIFVSVAAHRLYVQNGNVGVQVNLTTAPTGYRPGTRVDVSGKVHWTDPAVRVMEATARIIGEGPLPVAPVVSPHRLVRGENAFRYVRVHCLVRDMYLTRNGLVLLVTHDGYPFEVSLQAPVSPLPRHWTDAELELSGFAFPTYPDPTRPPTGFRFWVNSTNDFRVLSPGIADRFDGRPLLTIAEAAKLTNSLKARFRVAGTVMVHRPGTAFYIDDGTGVMLVDNTFRHLNAPPGADRLDREPQTWLQPGERVEVIGCRHNWFTVAPSLMATEYRRLGRGASPEPIPVTLKELVDGKHPGRLVTLTAQLIDARKWGTSNLKNFLNLVLRVDDDIFEARWESETPAKWDLSETGYVRITGVNDAEGSPNSKRTTFKLLLRSPADVVRAPAPPFWQRREVQRISAAAGGVALLAGVWIILQRVHMRRLEQRVAERTADLSGANALLQEEVAARQRAELEVQRALAHEKELSELKSRFVSMVSHEFRTPLGIIMSSAEILDAYLDRLPPEERRDNLRDITQSSKHMAAMMEEVLLLGRVEAGKMACNPAPLDLGALCARLADEVTSATSARCRIELQVAPGLGEAVADEGLLRHILTNLLNNAVKYSPAGASVELAVAAEEHLGVFTVRDHGIGIPEADQRQIFQAFHRGRNVGETPGTGLGMVIVKHCVQLHGGKIAFESREGAGTRFVVALPVFPSLRSGSNDNTQLFRKLIDTHQLTPIS
jgi:signal transduction histidine kinase